MNKLYLYLCFIILGIIIYIILNNVNSFSIGAPFSVIVKSFATNQILRDAAGTSRKIYANYNVLDLSTESSDGISFPGLDQFFSNIGNIHLPIYLGSFQKTPSRGSRYWPTRHFFIIDKMLYYFESTNTTRYYGLNPDGSVNSSDYKMSGILVPKNFGDERMRPIVLVNDDKSGAILSEVEESGLIVKSGKFRITCSRYDTSYEIYGSIDSINKLKKDLEDYMSLMISGKVTSQCSVSFQTSENLLRIQIADALAPPNSLESPFICSEHKSTYTIEDFGLIRQYQKSSGSEPEPIIDAYIQLQSWKYSAIPGIDFRYMMKGILEYNGNKLKYLRYISSGGFGSVWLASNIRYESFSTYGRDGAIPAYAIAIKVYQDQVDPEIELIRNINRLETNLCETVNARIITLSEPRLNSILTTEYDDDEYDILDMPDPFLKEHDVAVMEFMDGDLTNLPLKIRSTYPNSRYFLPFNIMRSLVRNLICLDNLGKAYGDLKSDNILYRCYTGNKMKISLGDLGSITEKYNKTIDFVHLIDSIDFHDDTFKNHDASSAETNDISIYVVWSIGIVICQLFDHQVPLIIRFNCAGFISGVVNPTTFIDQYFRNPDVQTFIRSLPTLLDDLKNDINDTHVEAFNNILTRIFVKSTDRITLREIHTILEDLGELEPVEEGEPPEPEPEPAPDCSTFTIQEDCDDDYCIWDSVNNICIDK